ncbi:DNA replication complex GINS protein PSF1 [Tetranychus urticae]|uniref:DNA replication complex GINS protein PSF1 n=1 Tax=Tetranychus urticae TaxID=32264 RepID=T1L2Y3_TETUR|nr:DNA replication complex GINS protein PSF1 [Tetranychus urticae]
MNFIDRCVSLLKELSSSKKDFLPVYNNEIVSECITTMKRLFEENQKEALDTSTDSASSQDGFIVVKIRHSILLFIKRCLIAYHHERLNRLKKLRWEFGSELPTEVSCNLTPKEIEWFAKYCSNLSDYMGRLNEGRGFDLTLNRTAPKRIFIQVRCLQDHGDHELEDGTTVCLQKDNLYYLPFSQCEKLIHQGIIEQVSD